MMRPIDVIGHRGARGLFPENTSEGFRAALDLGVTAFELDVGLTADGVVVVSHDLRLNPVLTRDGAGRWLSGQGPLLHDLTYAELQTYDVGRIRPGTPYCLLYRKQARRDGARIPRLEDVLRLSADATFIIELKTDPRVPSHTAAPERLADAVLAVVDAAGAAPRVIVESFDWRGPRHVRRVRPDIRLAWLTRAETVRDAALWWDGPLPAHHAGSVPAAVAAETSPSSAAIWAPAWMSLTHAEVREAHGLGVPVFPWTVNRRAAMRRLIRWGVDGLITDRPDIAMREVQSAML